MRVGIVGSRTFTDEALMWVALEELMATQDPHAIVSGGAVGADALAKDAARSIGLSYIEHLPDKERYGWPRAAFERNTLIVEDSDVILAFFGPGEPESVNKSGTMDTVRKAIAKRVPVRLYFR